jgi:hypothetical protein
VVQRHPSRDEFDAMPRVGDRVVAVVVLMLRLGMIPGLAAGEVALDPGSSPSERAEFARDRGDTLSDTHAEHRQHAVHDTNASDRRRATGHGDTSRNATASGNRDTVNDAATSRNGEACPHVTASGDSELRLIGHDAAR